MGDLPSTSILVHPTTYGPPNHSRVSRWTRYFQPTMWEPRGLPLGKIDAIRLFHSHSRCLPLKGGNSLRWPSNSRNAHFGVTYRFRPTWKWSKTINHASVTCGSKTCTIKPHCQEETWTTSLNSLNHFLFT